MSRSRFLESVDRTTLLDVLPLPNGVAFRFMDDGRVGNWDVGNVYNGVYAAAFGKSGSFVLIEGNTVMLYTFSYVCLIMTWTRASLSQTE